jgi:membrane dipeptidase
MWFERGVRLVGLSWLAGSSYAGGNAYPGPLTDKGRELLEVMAELGMILDVSHLAEEALSETMDRYEGWVVASHANPRARVPGQRQLSDATIRRLAERGGVIGVVLYNAFLRPGWSKGDPKDAVTPADVAAAVDHVCQVVGDVAHVGLGSDFDGGFGAESAPQGIDTVADLRRLIPALGEMGYGEEEVAAVMGGNWLRLLREALPE